ncbi:hypothetical protein C8R45DRAFT_1098229 [Mycena sanguinolenta]|nr:hypothetical protein C8R45DRAFT_1098229 [Mycena sanguinolenta]
MLSFFKKSKIFTPPNAFQTASGVRFLSAVHGFAGRVKVGFPDFFFEQPNLVVITNATVSRILWANGYGSNKLAATGVEYLLFCLWGPKVLELSGVVNPTTLKAAGVAYFPTVGENFADHVHSWANAFLDAVKHGVDDSLVIMNGARVVGLTLAHNWLIPAFLPNGPAIRFRVMILAAGCGAISIRCMIAVKTLASVVVVGVLYGLSVGVYIKLIPPLLVILTEDIKELGLRMGVAFAVEVLSADQRRLTRQ